VFRRLGFSLAVVIVSTIAGARSARAFSAGVVGNCASCHTGGVTTPVTFNADNLCLTSGMTTTINVSGNVVSGGSAGLDLAIASGPGSFAIGGPNAAGTKISGADVTQSMAKLGSPTVSFSAIFVAPSVSATTTVQLHVFFLGANNDGTPTGDSTNQANLTLTVAPAPTCGPGGCGTITNACGASVNCGNCAPPGVCGGGGVPNICCTPITCAGKACGSVPDGCGGVLNCGICPGGQRCNAQFQCVAPPPPSVPALGGVSPFLLGAILLLAGAIGIAGRRRPG